MLDFFQFLFVVQKKVHTFFYEKKNRFFYKIGFLLKYTKYNIQVLKPIELLAVRDRTKNIQNQKFHKTIYRSFLEYIFLVFQGYSNSYSTRKHT